MSTGDPDHKDVFTVGTILDYFVNHLSLDSRKMQFPPTMFIGWRVYYTFAFAPLWARAGDNAGPLLELASSRASE
jgi:hypothetical protein